MSKVVVKGADGKFYREVPSLEEPGGTDYVEEPLSASSEVVELGREGHYVMRERGSKIVLATELPPEMRDRQVYEQQRKPQSSDDFFRQQRHKKRRADAVQRRVEQMVGDRVSPGASAGVRQIKDGQFFDFQRMYMQAQEKGVHRECEFQPLAAYQHKVTRARPILKGEVGMHGSVILVLEVGYGEGAVVQVPVELEHAEEAQKGRDVAVSD